MNKLNGKFLAILLSVILCGLAQAKERDIYLYVMFHDDNTRGERFRTRMKDMAECFQVIERSKLPMPTRPAGDYEVMGAMWCGGEMERNDVGAWHIDNKLISKQDN